MTRKEIAMQFSSALIGAVLASIICTTAAASKYGEKIEKLERQIERKAESGAVVELATKSDVRALGDMIAGKAALQDRRDAEQDRRIDTMERVQTEQGKTLSRVDKNLDVVIAILDPDGRVSRTIKRD